MKKFVNGLLITGEREEIEEIIPSLLEIGYKWDKTGKENKRLNLSTDYAGYNGTIGWSHNNRNNGSRYPIGVSNKDLVLALAAATEGDEFTKGELLISDSHCGKYIIIFDRINDRGYTSYSKMWVGERFVENDYIANSDIESRFRKATKEEIITHFTPKIVEEWKAPERWYVSPKNEEEMNVVKMWAWKKHPNTAYNDYHWHPEVNFNQEGYYRGKPGGTKITFEQFKQITMNMQQQQNQDCQTITQQGQQFQTKDQAKKIIGYKIKDGVDKIAAAAACKSGGFLYRTSECDFKIYDAYYEAAVKAGVLDLLFVPVYASNTETTIGIKGINFIVFKDGTVKSPQGAATISDVENLIERIMYFNNTLGVGGFGVYINSIHIGCDDGYTLELNDLQSIVSAYKLLQ